MRLSFSGIGVVALGATLIANACSGVCTNVGCQPGFSAKVHRADGSFPTGTHQVAIVAGGGTSQPTCPSGMTIWVLPVTDCTETNSGSSGTETCTDIPGQFVEWITLTGTPAEVQAQQSVDGAVILDATVAPTYQEVAPNDVECGPICHQALVDWPLQ
jgi:hypothetical protein